MDDWVRAYRHELDGDGVDPDDAPRGDEAARGARAAERVAAPRAIPPRRRPPRRDRTASGPADRLTGREADAGMAAGIRSDETHVFPRFLDLAVPEHRARRRRLADHDRRAPDPGRVLGRRDGRRASAHGVPGDRRGRRRAGRTALVLLQPPLHERAAGAAGRSAAGGRGAGDGAGPARLRRVRGERDGAAARPAVPRRARRHRALARDLAGAVLPRVDDGDAGAHRPARAPGAVHAVPRVAPPHPALAHGGSTRRGEAALAELDRLLEEAGPETVAAFFCEPVGAAALPGASPPDRFWEGLEERRERARVPDLLRRGRDRASAAWGRWLAADQLPIEPDIVAIGKGLGAGYAPLGAVLCRQHVYDAIDRGSREFDLGHTWDGAPLSSAVGSGRARPPGRARPGRPGPRARARSPGRARGRARGLRHRPRGPGSGLPPRRGARGPAGRRVVPARSTSTSRRSSTTPRSSTACSSPPPIRRPTATPGIRRCSRRPT